MPTVIGYHDVKDTDHWLASPKREEFFGPLGVSNIRTFVDPTNRTRVAVLMDVADMDAVMQYMQTPDAAAAMEHDGVVAESLVILLEQGAAFPPAIVAVGGGPVPGPLLERARKAGLRVVQTWGMTETCSMATCERPRDADGATAGPPLSGFDVVVEGGEVLVRGPAVMRGYLGGPPIEGRFFRTGDLGELDARGRLIVHARRGDLIVSGGENVYPAEVEAALLEHPAVREAAVLPASDERWGQVGLAYVVTTASDGELRDFLRTRLAKYKVPARFVRLRELPRNAAGKVDRAGLLTGNPVP